MQSKELLKQIKKVATKFIGPLPVIKKVLDMLDVRGIIDKHCPTEGKAAISDSIFTMVSNRLSSPAPLSNIEEWAEESAIVSVMDVADVAYNDDRLGRALDAIYPNIKLIWTEVLFNAINTFGLDINSVFYDITSIYFEGEYNESLLISHGYSRDQKPDKKQINLSLNLTQRDSIPLLYNLFKGKTNDQTTVIDNMGYLDNLMKKLSKRGGSSPLTVIGDRLMLNDKIAITYDSQGMHFIGTMDDSKNQDGLIRFVPDEILKSSPLEFKDRHKRAYYGVAIPHLFSYIEAAEGKPVLKIINSETGKGVEKQYILEAIAHIFFSESKFIQDEKSFKEKIKKAEDVFKSVKGKLNQRKYKSKEYTLQQLNNKLKGKTGRFFFEYEVIGEDGNLSLVWKIKENEVKEERELFGKYVIYTNDSSKDSERILRDYKEKDKIEKSFSGLKGPFKVRPVFLKNEKRIEALVFVILLSYLIFSLIRKVCKNRNVKISEKSFIRIFRSLNSVVIVMKDGSTSIMMGDLTVRQRKIFDSLGIVHPP